MDIKSVHPQPVETLAPRRWARLVVVHLLVPLILFACAGDIGWWQAWVFSAMIVIAGIGSRIWAERRHPGLLVERDRSVTAQGVKSWDKTLSPLMALSLSFPLVIVAGLDHRFGWSPVFPIWLNLLGFVCDSGPYRIVRHPGYAGNILSLPGIALALSSVWTFIPALVALVIAVTRTSLEDRTLQEELPGYRDYARRVRYRLFPRIY
jgi:protein-S-isoprenylcysteine O-methyltransferase Ste14